MTVEGPNPYWEQAKHVVGATSLFILIFAVAIGIDRLAIFLISIGWLNANGLFHWALQGAEIVLFLLDVAALLVIASVTTYKYVRRLIG